MRTLVFKCPTTGRKVQGWFSDDPSEASDEAYESVVCTACRNVHLVNRVSGRTLGASDE
jgi:hypothetical protein